MTRPSLQRAQADDVLRYWLALLRLEEALDVRPQARRPVHGVARPRLDQPTPGQTYFKLALDDALSGLLALREPVTRPLDGESSAFFETWLDGQYRRGDEQDDLSQLLCFPVVHLPRGELAGLLRCGVRVRFGNAGGTVFRVPTRSERQRGAYPPVPDEARVTQATRAEGAWPFFLDTRLLNHTLGVSSESIDALFDSLRAHEQVSEERMLAAVVETLEQAAGPREESRAPLTGDAVQRTAALLTRMMEAMRVLLQRNGRAQVYPVGIVIDGTQAKTTWHLQRELRELLDRDGDSAWSLDSALGAYLTGRALPSAEVPQRALYPGPGFTPSQRAAADHAWGSRFSCVQGPPGTGKTTLILHLCAEALVRKAESWVDRGVMDDSVLLICSSNNRAVDNVTDALRFDAGLPLALRAGSRQVCEQVLAPQLRRTLQWLTVADNEPHDQRLLALQHSAEEFRQVRARITALHAPRRAALAQTEECAQLREELAELERAFDTDADQEPTCGPPPLNLDENAAGPLLTALYAVEKRLLALSKLCEATPGLAQVNAVARHYGRTAAHDLPGLEVALSALGLSLPLPLPPLVAPTEVSQLMAAWEEGAEQSLALLGDLRDRLESQRARRERTRLRQERTQQVMALRERLSVLEASLPRGLPEVQHDDALARQLHAAAVSVREKWAKAQAADLRLALEAALSTLEEQRSLRPLFRNDPEHARTLRQLFGIWGSTLLSLGNCFPPEAGSIDRTVIDEAGQCHPAHAISALMRTDSAMVIGDTQQLSPVVDLEPEEEQRLLRGARVDRAEIVLAPYRVHRRALTSAQHLAERAVIKRHDLVDHFRCQREIIAISDALCAYDLLVHTPVASRRREAPLLEAPVCWVDVSGTQEALGGSLWNARELRETVLMVQRLLAHGIAPEDIAVITPYRGQLERLRRSFADLRIPLEFSPELMESEGAGLSAGAAGLALGTVHRFQGGERSIVLFSSVITRPESLGFLNARPNLLNVAVSRARHHFVGIGCRSVLARGSRTRLLTEAARAVPALADVPEGSPL